MLKQSENINLNYCAKVVRIDAIEPIQGADRIVKATVGTDKVVVGKDMHVGDIVVFFPCETVICDKYLGHHNLFEANESDRNSNRDEVATLRGALAELAGRPQLTEEDMEQRKVLESAIRAKVGFFNKTGRVRCLKLRGEYSLGYVAPVSTLEDVWPELKSVIWSHEIDKQFDMIGKERICWKYIPPIKNREANTNPQGRYKKSQKKLKRFDRLVPDQFRFHYDTGKLVDNMHVFMPHDTVDMTVKVHGTSVILSKLLVNRQLTLWEKIKKFFGADVPMTEYGDIYSSRRVIKNQYINQGQCNQFYTVDAHGACARDFSEFLENGMTVYGEIVGYVEGTSTYIQKNHDYGCKPGEWKFMPYRITFTDEFGNVREESVTEVNEWTMKLKAKLEAQGDIRATRLMPMEHLYNGKIGELYDDLYMQIVRTTPEEEFGQEVENYKNSLENWDGYLPKRFESHQEYILNKWRTELLEAMKADTKWLGMEKREPMCKNKVPREGIVFRIEDDPKAGAFKLKSAAHYDLERMAADAGEEDIEA